MVYVVYVVYVVCMPGLFACVYLSLFNLKNPINSSFQIIKSLIRGKNERGIFFIERKRKREMITEENCDSAQQVPTTTEATTTEAAARPQGQPQQASESEPQIPIPANSERAEEGTKAETEESLRAELEAKTLLLNRNENRIREQAEEIQQLRSTSARETSQSDLTCETDGNECDVHMEIIQLREKRNLFFEQCEALKRDNDNMQSEIDNYLSKEVSHYATERKRLNDSRKSLSAHLATASTAHRVLNHKYAQAKERKKELEKRVSALTEENNRLKTENSTISADSEKCFREYKSKSELFARNFAILQAQLSAEREAAGGLRAHVVAADAAVRELRTQVAQERLNLAHERENYGKLVARYKILSESYEKHLGEAQERAAADALALRNAQKRAETSQIDQISQIGLAKSGENRSNCKKESKPKEDFELCRGLMTDVELERVKERLMNLATSSDNANGNSNAALVANELCAALQNLNMRYDNLAKRLESEAVRSNIRERELSECRDEAARMKGECAELERLRAEHADMAKMCAEQKEELARLRAERGDLTRRAVSSEFKCKALDRELAQALLSKSFCTVGSSNGGGSDSQSNGNGDGNDIAPKDFVKFDNVVDLQNKYNDLLFMMSKLQSEATVAERQRLADENKRLEDELNRANAQCATLKEELSAGEREREALLALLRNSETAKESGDVFLDASQHFSAAFKRHREEARRTEERLEAEVQDLSKRLVQSQKECAELNVTLESENARSEALKAENKRIREVNLDYVQQIGRDEAALNARDEELSKVRTLLENAQRGLRAAQREASEQQRNAQRLETANAALVTANETLVHEKETLSAAVAELTALRDACDDTQDSLNELQRKHIQESAAQVTALKEVLARKTAEASTMEAALRIQVEEIRQRLVAAEARCAETRGELAVARGDESALRVELRAERDQRELLNKKIADVNAEHRITLYDREHSLAEKVRAHEARNTELAEQLRAERERTAALSAENELAAAERRACAAKIDKISEEAGKRIAECGDKLIALQRQLDEAEEARKEVERRKLELEDELVELKTAEYTRDTLKKQIQSLYDEKKRVAQELKKYADAAATQQRQLRPQQSPQQTQQLQPQTHQQPQNELSQQQKNAILREIEKGKQLAEENEKLKQELAHEKTAREQSTIENEKLRQELDKEKASHEQCLDLYKDVNEHAKRLEEELMGNAMTEHTQSPTTAGPTTQRRNKGEEHSNFYEEEIRNKEEIAKLRECVNKYKEEIKKHKARINELETLYKGVPTAVAYEEEQKRLFMLDVTLDSNNMIRSEKNKAEAELKKLREDFAELQGRFGTLNAENSNKSARIASLEEQVVKLTELGPTSVMQPPPPPPQPQQPQSQPKPQSQPQSQSQPQPQQQNTGMKRGRDDQKLKQMQPRQKQNKLFK